MRRRSAAGGGEIAAHAVHGGGQSLLRHRLDHIVTRIDLEGLGRELGVRRDEDDARARFCQLVPGREHVLPGHLDVEQQRVDALRPKELGQRIGIAADTDDLDARIEREQPLQA